MTTATRPKCWEKISEKSGTYLRRLAKEIWARAYSGVYVTFPDGERDRVIGASTGGKGPDTKLYLRLMSGERREFVDGATLDNGAGDAVCAARTVCGR